jgi:hypothetical protein
MNKLWKIVTKHTTVYTKDSKPLMGNAKEESFNVQFSSQQEINVTDRQFIYNREELKFN